MASRRLVVHAKAFDLLIGFDLALFAGGTLNACFCAVVDGASAGRAG